MLKVLHYIPGFLFGGIESMYLGWYSQIDKSQVQFDLLLRTQDDDATALVAYREMGGVYYRLPTIRRFFSYVHETKNFFRDHHDYDILHSHGTDLIVCYFAKKYGIKKIIVHSHSASSTDALSEKVKSIPGKLAISLYGDLAFACSKLAAEYRYGGLTFHGKPVEIIHNAIDTTKYRFDEAIREQYRNDSSLSSKTVVGHVGRLTYPKNQFFLLDIFQAYFLRNKNAFLLMVGDGPDKEQLKSHAEELGVAESVLFLGARNDVPELLQAMDLFLLPSRWEGLPVTLVEAQAAGLPCVISDVISDEADVTDAVVRCSISDSPETWASAMDSVLQAVSRNDCSEKVAASGYDISVETQKLIDRYQNCVSS